MIKLQHLAVIFAIIIIPVSLVLGYYVRSEIDTLKLQASYDECLINATYDAIKAYQINTAKENYAEIETSAKREVEAAINTFMDSFATGIGASGYGEDAIKPYVPAILFTLNKTFFIYSPTYNNDTGEYEHILKPYYTYTTRYVKASEQIDVYISYSLDNYIVVTGMIKGKFVNKSGYLIDQNYMNSSNENDLKEELYERIPIYITNTPEFQYEIKTLQYKYLSNTTESAEKIYYDKIANLWFYYKEGVKYYISGSSSFDKKDDNALLYKNNNGYGVNSEGEYNFTEWIIKNLGSLTVKDMQISDDVKSRNDYLHYLDDTNSKIFDSSKGNFFDNPDSVFNIHKNDIIRMSIKESLSSAITAYNEHAGVKGTFKMPVLKENEWDQVTKNICAIAFVQGLPTGLKTFNSYAIVNNTDNSNYLDQEDFVFIDQADSDTSEYHMIDCPKLKQQVDEGKIQNLVGYKKSNFEATTVEMKYKNVSGATVRETINYYQHLNVPCYDCIVSKNYERQNPADDTNKTRLKALQTALGREKNIMH